VNFCLVNKSSVVSDRQLRVIAAACEVQMRRDVMPAWRRLPCSVSAGAPQSGDLVIVLADTLDEANALGYHTEDAAGAITGLIGVGPIVDAGGGTLIAGRSGDSVSAVVSHEIIEAKFDPNCNLYADTLGRTPGYASMAFELCDPVQGSGYEMNDGPVQGVFVSNFVLPAYWDAFNTVGPWDFMGRLKGSFTIEAGGYACLRNSPSDEKSVFGAGGESRPWRSHGRAARRLGRV
jgi:hypothetical protein